MPSDDFVDAGDTSQNWRSELPGKKGMAREVRIIVFAFLLAVIIGLVIAIITYLIPPRVETQFVFVPVTDYLFKDQHLDLPEVPLGKDDARELRKALQLDEEKFQLAKYRNKSELVTFLTNQFNSEPDKKSADKSLVVFLSALGRTGTDHQPYLLPTNFDQDDPKSWIPLKEIVEKIQMNPARNKLLILDLACPTACVSREPFINDVSNSIDAMLGQMIKDKTLKMPVYTSCSAGETSHRKWPLTQSVFGYYLMSGLQGKALASPDKVAISVNDLEKYVSGWVDFWARKCLLASQHPKLYHPADYQDFPIVKANVSHGREDQKTTRSTSPETADEKKAAESKKLDELNTNLKTKFFTDDLRKAWEAHDTMGKSEDWLLVYPLLRQWERQLLSAEHRLQATGELDQASFAVPRLYERPRLSFIYGLHHLSPKVTGLSGAEEVEWNKQLTEARKHDFRKKDDLSSKPWFDQVTKAGRGHLIAQALWNSLENTSPMTLDTLKNFCIVFEAIGQKEPSIKETSIEFFVVQALTNKLEDLRYENALDARGKAGNAANFKRMVKIIEQLEAEVGEHISNPEFLPNSKAYLEQSQSKLFQAITDQFSEKASYRDDDSPEPITLLLRESEKALEQAKEQRMNLKNGRRNFWESVRTLYATSEYVVYASEEKYQAWKTAAEATSRLGNMLNDPSKMETPPVIRLDALSDPYKAGELEKLKVRYKELSVDANRTAEILAELKSAQLPASFREECWRTVLREIEENNRKLDNKPQSSTPIDNEQVPAGRREQINALLREIAGVTKTDKLSDLAQKRQELISQKAWFKAARLECLMLPKDLPKAEKLALVLENQLATIDLAQWLRTRLETQHQLLAKFKIDPAYETVYTRAKEACAKLSQECQDLLK